MNNIYESYIDIPTWLLTAPDDCKANIILDLIKNHLTSRNLIYTDFSTLKTAIHINVLSPSVTFSIETSSPLPKRSKTTNTITTTTTTAAASTVSGDVSTRVITTSSITLKEPWSDNNSKNRRRRKHQIHYY